jgi:hypothetical protein
MSLATCPRDPHEQEGSSATRRSSGAAASTAADPEACDDGVPDPGSRRASHISGSSSNGGRVRTAKAGPLLSASFNGNLPREWWGEGVGVVGGGGKCTWESLVHGSAALQLLFPQQPRPHGGRAAALWPPPRRPTASAAASALAQRLAGPLPLNPKARFCALRARLRVPAAARAQCRRRPRPWGLAWARPAPASPSRNLEASTSSSSSSSSSSRSRVVSLLDSQAPGRFPPDLAALFPSPPNMGQQPPWGVPWLGAGVTNNSSGRGHIGTSSSSSNSSTATSSSCTGSSVGRRRGRGIPAASGAREQRQPRGHAGAASPDPLRRGGAAAGSSSAVFGAGATGAAVWCDLPAGYVPLSFARAAMQLAAAAGGGSADEEDEDGVSGGEGEDEEEDDWVFDAEDDEGLEEGDEEEWDTDEEEEENDEGASRAGSDRFVFQRDGVIFGYWSRAPLG